MPESISIRVNGARMSVPPGTTVLAAILSAGISTVRRSVSAEPRGPLCAMGICFECRATVNHERHARTCQLLCAAEMEVCTDD
jgi:D-hydroxyproline dehydrogenase subunit gamma